MKKLVIAAAVLAAGFAIADDSSLVSSSIVGYETVNVASKKYVALAVQFEGIGETVSIPVKDLVTVASPAGAASIGGGTDQIWRWDTAGNDWAKYFYRSGRGVTTPGWCKSGETALTTDTISAGETCFFFRGGSSDTTLTLSGAVKQFAASASYSVPSKSYVFMGYPWPVAFTISKMSDAYTSGTPSGAASIGGGTDQIWRWDTTGNDWAKYFYRSGRGVTTPGWCKSGETAITTDTIPAGEGFFFFRGGSGDVEITFTYPTTSQE